MHVLSQCGELNVEDVSTLFLLLQKKMVDVVHRYEMEISPRSVIFYVTLISDDRKKSLGPKIFCWKRTFLWDAV